MVCVYNDFPQHNSTGNGFIYMLQNVGCHRHCTLFCVVAEVVDRRQDMVFFWMPKSLHALITDLPSIKWKIHHSTSTDLAHK